MEKKLTKREVLTMIAGTAEVQESSIMTEFIQHELELLDRRTSRETKVNKERDAFRAAIMEVLTGSNDGITATDLAKTLDVTVQKISGNLTAMVTEGKVIRRVDGKKVLFAAV